ncbi:MAG TPA: hypothetical protein VEL73_00270, partial [Mycobacteriales bacterium]|nr:hypothetical protein [Mycobacteriales bacterium]
FRQDGDGGGEAEATGLLGLVHFVSGDYPAAVARWREARTVTARLGPAAEQLDAWLADWLAAAGSLPGSGSDLAQSAAAG